LVVFSCKSGIFDLMNGLKELKSAVIKDKRIRFPSLPEIAITCYNYTDKTANGLTRCIIDWIELNGYQAERISSSGRYIDGKQTYTDVLGQKKTIGTGKWIPGSSTKGTADISATIKGRSVKIEVKIGKDRQSEAQVAYQKKVEQSGGLYFIAKDFDTFMEFYVSLTA
jgi:hypothetical protein